MMDWRCVRREAVVVCPLRGVALARSHLRPSALASRPAVAGATTQRAAPTTPVGLDGTRTAAVTMQCCARTRAAVTTTVSTRTCFEAFVGLCAS